MSQRKVVQIRHRNGQLQEEQPRFRGKLHGVLRRWHRNGVLALEQPHEHGQVNGTCRQWAEDGRLLGSFEIQHGTGIHRHWHENGQLQSEVSTVEGKLTGRHRTWLRDGTLAFERYYLENVPVDRKRYDAAAAQAPRLPRYTDGEAQWRPLAAAELERRQHDLFVSALLEKRNQSEAQAWLKAGMNDGKLTSLGHFKRVSHAVSLIDRLYAAGARTVLAVDLYENTRGDGFCDRLVIKLPKAEGSRTAIRKICQGLCARDQASLSPKSDLGEAHLCLLL